MPYLTSLFALLLIGALLIWTSSYRFFESVWERQAIKFTEHALQELNRAKHELLVLEAFAKASRTKKEEDGSIPSKRQAKIVEFKETKNPKRASRYLHLHSLFDPSVNIDDPIAKAARIILNRLSAILFASQPFYADMDVDEFYKATMEAARKETKAKAMKKSKELANLEMATEKDQYHLYKVLRGGGAAIVGTRGSYHSLLEFISLEKRPTLLNLYLAPYPLLLALFGDEKIALKVLEYRHELYLKLEKKREAKEELEQQFRSEFEQAIPHDIGSYLIDFNISLTRPSAHYELLDANLLELP